MRQSYADRRISLPFPVKLHQLGSQWLIEWFCENEDNPVNREFFKQIKGNQENHKKIFSVYKEDEVRKSQIQPALFVFHVSRCGSTLAANYLATDEENRVYNEPNVLGKLFSDLNEGSVDIERDFTKHIDTLRMGALPGQKRLIIKLSSRYLKYTSLFDKFYPEVPKWLIVRNPTEVLASNVIKSPEHILNQIEGDYSETKCIALVLKSWADTFKEALDFQKSFNKIVDYTELKEELMTMEQDLWTPTYQPERQELIKQIFVKSSKRRDSLHQSDTKEKLLYNKKFSVTHLEILLEMERNYRLTKTESN